MQLVHKFYIKFTNKFLFGKNLAIWTQPGPRLAYLISHDLIYIFLKTELSSLCKISRQKQYLTIFIKILRKGQMRKDFIENPAFTF